MSADRWSICPQCARNRAAEAAAKRAEADASYGVLPRDEWMALDGLATKLAVPSVAQTLREDWDIYGVEEGVVSITYSANCEACRLSVSTMHDVPLLPESPK